MRNNMLYTLGLLSLCSSSVLISLGVAQADAPLAGSYEAQVSGGTVPSMSPPAAPTTMPTAHPTGTAGATSAGAENQQMGIAGAGAAENQANQTAAVAANDAAPSDDDGGFIDIPAGTPDVPGGAPGAGGIPGLGSIPGLPAGFLGSSNPAAEAKSAAVQAGGALLTGVTGVKAFSAQTPSEICESKNAGDKAVCETLHTLNKGVLGAFATSLVVKNLNQCKGVTDGKGRGAGIFASADNLKNCGEAIKSKLSVNTKPIDNGLKKLGVFGKAIGAVVKPVVNHAASSVQDPLFMAAIKGAGLVMQTKGKSMCVLPLVRTSINNLFNPMRGLGVLSCDFPIKLY